MNTIILRQLTVSEFNYIDNPLANSIFAHYAHTAMSTANLARIYNYMMAFNVNPMHSVEQHLDVLARAERAYNF
jgi:hypothetical protein